MICSKKTAKNWHLAFSKYDSFLPDWVLVAGGLCRVLVIREPRSAGGMHRALSFREYQRESRETGTCQNRLSQVCWQTCTIKGKTPPFLSLSAQTPLSQIHPLSPSSPLILSISCQGPRFFALQYNIRSIFSFFTELQSKCLFYLLEFLLNF